MDIRGLVLIEEFIQIHRDAEGPLRRWVAIVAAVRWHNFQECRGKFSRAADPVALALRTVTVFNIKGNHYRLVAAINYAGSLVVIRRIMTHAEYDKQDWKALI